MTRASSLPEVGLSKLVLCDNPEGWSGEGGGMVWSGWGAGVQNGETHVYPWVIHVNVWQNPPQYCK